MSPVAKVAILDRDSAPSFVLARYVTRSSRALYAGYGTATWQGILAVIESRRGQRIVDRLEGGASDHEA